MKALLFIVFSLTFLNTATATVTDQDFNDLAQRVKFLENKVTQSLKKCNMIYKSVGHHHFRCPQNTFVHSVQPVGSNVMLLECGYYQMQCYMQH